MQTLPWHTPENCAFHNRKCKPYGRLYVVIGDQDELGAFVLRTTSYNSIRTLAARMRYFHAVSGGLLACMPLELRLRGWNNARRSHQRGATQGCQTERDRLDQAALDEAAHHGFANGSFEESVEDVCPP